VLDGFSDATLRKRGMPAGRLKLVATPLATDQAQHLVAVADITLDAPPPREDGWTECEPIRSRASDYVQTSRTLRLVTLDRLAATVRLAPWWKPDNSSNENDRRNESHGTPNREFATGHPPEAYEEK
jgi:hypothetical protein